MSYENIEFDIGEGIARLTLNRPARLNSFTVAMHGEISDALARVEAASGVRTMLVTGNGRGFCAGQDLSDRNVAPGSAAIDLGESVERFYNPLVRRIVALPFPVVCAVNGVAAGAGANIALACDVVLAARSATFIQSFAAIGLVPDTGGSWVLPRLVGQARALGMALIGEAIPAETAAAWGLIWKIIDDERLVEESEALVARFSKAPTAGLAATKRLIRGTWLNSLDQELAIQRDAMSRLGQTDDYREGVAAFLEKRAPVFTGR